MRPFGPGAAALVSALLGCGAAATSSPPPGPAAVPERAAPDGSAVADAPDADGTAVEERAVATGTSTAPGDAERFDGPGAGGSRDRPATVTRIRTGGPDVRGGLSADVVLGVFRRREDEIRSCYEQELARSPALEGRVVLQFVIAPNGTVERPGIATSTLDSEPVERCMVEAVGRWTFPAPDGGASVGVNLPVLLDVPEEADEADE